MFGDFTTFKDGKSVSLSHFKTLQWSIALYTLEVKAECQFYVAKFATVCAQHTWILGKIQTMWFLNSNEIFLKGKGQNRKKDKGFPKEVEI